MISSLKFILGITFSLLVSWHICSLYDFFYPQLYHWLNISQHINQYAPENIYKYGFQLTSTQERLEIFSNIVDAINNNGLGLDKITYRPKGMVSSIQFLRKEEIEHLLDVKHFVSIFNIIGIVSGILFFLITLYKNENKSEKNTLINIMSITLFSACLLSSNIWFEDVFYALHEFLFPKDNQWFFYYQESLMTTLMKAPDVFLYMFIIIVIISIAVFFTTQYYVIIFNNKVSDRKLSEYS